MGWWWVGTPGCRLSAIAASRSDAWCVVLIEMPSEARPVCLCGFWGATKWLLEDEPATQASRGMRSMSMISNSVDRLLGKGKGLECEGRFKKAVTGGIAPREFGVLKYPKEGTRSPTKLYATESQARVCH